MAQLPANAAAGDDMHVRGCADVDVYVDAVVARQVACESGTSTSRILSHDHFLAPVVMLSTSAVQSRLLNARYRAETVLMHACTPLHTHTRCLIEAPLGLQV
jgi:hypothetical protein